MPDLWELPDAELWGQLDASLLEDQFRASEVEERTIAARHRVRPLLPSELAFLERLGGYLADACTRFARACIDAQYAFHLALHSLYDFGPAPEKSKHRTRPHGLTQPRTLHLALQVNARPVLNRRTARREWRQQGRG